MTENALRLLEIMGKIRTSFFEEEEPLEESDNNSLDEFLNSFARKD